MTRQDRGSAAVEFALVLPLALIAVLALVEIGVLARGSLAVQHAAREGAREAAVTRDEGRVREAALEGSGLAPERTVVEISRRGGMGEPVTVAVRYRAGFLGPVAGWLLPEEVGLSADVTMRQEIGNE